MDKRIEGKTSANVSELSVSGRVWVSLVAIVVFAAARFILEVV
jgi:hypothetical protein